AANREALPAGVPFLRHIGIYAYRARFLAQYAQLSRTPLEQAESLEQLRVLFVCLGNICRSPLVEAVARKRLAEAGLDVVVASCGTGGWHAGEGADPR